MKTPLYKKLIPRSIRLKWLKNDILGYLKSSNLNEEQQEVFEYLKDNPLDTFPYEFIKNYNHNDIIIEKDEDKNLLYTYWEGKKLFYKNGQRIEKARKYFNGLLLEQDLKSPHRYLEGDFDIHPNDVLVDVGAAEGNFSLSVIEKVKHVYLFEVEKEWIAALEATFEPWKNKVTIVQKYVSDTDSESTVTLDTYFGVNGVVNFIKADVEGAEGEVIRGASNLIQNQKNLRVAVCTYHRQEDAEVLDSQLKTNGFTNSFSDKYMIFYYGKINVVKPPYLRKAILRGIKF